MRTSIAADAFGNALGGAIAQQNSAPDQSAAETARLNALEPNASYSGNDGGNWIPTAAQSQVQTVPNDNNSVSGALVETKYRAPYASPPFIDNALLDSADTEAFVAQPLDNRALLNSADAREALNNSSFAT